MTVEGGSKPTPPTGIHIRHGKATTDVPNHLTVPFVRPAASSENARRALNRDGCCFFAMTCREKAPVRRAARPADVMERNMVTRDR